MSEEHVRKQSGNGSQYQLKGKWAVCSTYTARDEKERSDIGNMVSFKILNFLMGMKIWK